MKKSLFEANIYRISNQDKIWFSVKIIAFDDGYDIYQKLNNIVEPLNAVYGQVKWVCKIDEEE